MTDDKMDASKTESSTAGVITSGVLRDAPLVDQKFQDALPLLPGVVRGPDGNLNIKGTRPSQSGILVSSLNVTDPVTGSPAIELPLEAVETVKVYSNPYSAEYGKFSGAVTASRRAQEATIGGTWSPDCYRVRGSVMAKSSASAQ